MRSALPAPPPPPPRHTHAHTHTHIHTLHIRSNTNLRSLHMAAGIKAREGQHARWHPLPPLPPQQPPPRIAQPCDCRKAQLPTATHPLTGPGMVALVGSAPTSTPPGRSSLRCIDAASWGWHTFPPHCVHGNQHRCVLSPQAGDRVVDRLADGPSADGLQQRWQESWFVFKKQLSEKRSPFGVTSPTTP